jgi:hypothetical protein
VVAAVNSKIQEKKMGDPMKIRAKATGDEVEVKVLMAHEMETGQRKGLRRQSGSCVVYSERDCQVQRQSCIASQLGPGRVEESLHVLLVQGR